MSDRGPLRAEQGEAGAAAKPDPASAPLWRQSLG